EREHEANYNSTRHFPGARALMAYAYVLTHPGVPCVFWPHFFDWGPDARRVIGELIRVRRFAGPHSRRRAAITAAEGGLYAAVIDDAVAVKLGSRGWSPGHGWILAADGERFAVWARD